MVYFDTDVLVNYHFNQNQEKHDKAVVLYGKAIKNKSFKTSLVALQEFSYVSNRLGADEEDIKKMLENFIISNPLVYDADDFLRAIELAELVGFQHINDCLHTAIAENNGCTELLTFNLSDFKRIERHTELRITILT